jgi:hypothetical protein
MVEEQDIELDELESEIEDRNIMITSLMNQLREAKRVGAKEELVAIAKMINKKTSDANCLQELSLYYFKRLKELEA